MNDSGSPSTLVQLLRWRATLQSTEALYTFLADGEAEEFCLSYAELDRKARAIASKLQSVEPPGARALLLYHPGLEFIAAFFGCLYAGIVAVPAYPPRNPKSVPRIQTIASDAQASFCLTSSMVFARSRELFGVVPGLEPMLWLATDEIADDAAAEWKPSDLVPETLAFLQYTSGSTSTPKGVMVSHGNLMHNLSFLCGGRGHTKIVSWLPFFHDMGLIYAILQALYGGFPCVLMAPASFLQRPFRWLHALSRHRASTAIAPNFAYELCAQKISGDEKRQLDLSCWTMALNAAEPVRLETLERFAAAFASCGFRAEFLKPAYGLAEATLGVSIFSKPQLYCVKTLDQAAFEQHRIVQASSETSATCQAIGCGQGARDQKIAIVDPDTLRRCGPGRVGEIWLSSPSVAQGYWRKPQETEETFRAFIVDTSEGPFLRTGDLGFVDDEELFITGRLKDLIIIRGGNHYPQDLELTAQKAHRALQSDAGAAFSVEVDGEERLAIVQELIRHPKADLAEVGTAIREAIADEHGLQVYAIVLVKTHAVPKTSSGKIQRRKAREMFLERGFDVEWEWRAEVAKEPKEPKTAAALIDRTSQVEQAKSLEGWLISRLAEVLKIPADEIAPRQPFSRYGLDSLGAVMLAGELQTRLGRALPSSLLFDFPTIESLIRHLAADAAILDQPLRQNETGGTEPIAVIGIGCRFPGANNPDEFWKLLRDGIDAISEVPKERWDSQALYDPRPGTPGKMNTKWGGFLHDVEQFAADFFEISPREAIQMDPQQRLLLEVTWEALEHSGLPPTRLSGSKTGVFVGISGFDYSLRQLKELGAIDAYAGTGLAHSVAANRISYFLDLRGPSVAVDTACSSSLVAIHQACESLRRGESNVALAGGVNLILSPELTIALSHARMMAADGHCKTFDSRADGYVRGEGCGVVVLKRLPDAQRDGDRIWALVRGSAINQDGRSNGLTAPNGPAQEAVIRAALAQAGVPAREISFVECHGTGTSLGDPQEVEALNQVLGPDREPTRKCWLGSVKTNIGHLESAAGVAGFVKAVLALRHKKIPRNLHFQAINPHIRLSETPFLIPTQIADWPSTGRRLAGVSSFGFGGTNSHVILEEAPPAEIPPAFVDRPLHVLTLSAKTPEALRDLASAMARRLEIPLREPIPSPLPGGKLEDAAVNAAPLLGGAGGGFKPPSPDPLADICFTANAGRAPFDHLLALVTDSAAHAREQLVAFCDGQKTEGVFQASASGRSRPKIAFLFTGQGSQYAGMGKQFYETQPTFRMALDRCDEILRPLLEQPLWSVLYPEPGKTSPLDETKYAQPALFSIEYALATLWQSWGITPDAMLGHSVGEYVAACVSGVFELEAGLKLIATRARLMDALPRIGQMAMVFAPPEKVEQAIAGFGGSISVAAINGPELTVISGEKNAVGQILKDFSVNGIRHQTLAVSHAFHSPLMEPMLQDFRAVSEGVRYHAPRIPMISNLTGDWFASDKTPDAAYWTRHIRRPVEFAKGISTLVKAGFTHFLECGPNPTLLAMAKRGDESRAQPQPNRAWLASLKKGEDDWRIALPTLAQLYLDGAEIDWRGFDRDYRRRIVSLPSYPFQRRSYWVEKRTDPSAKVSPDDAAWPRILEAGRQRAAAGFAGSSFEAEAEKFALLNRLAEGYLVRALKKLGVISTDDTESPGQRLRHAISLRKPEPTTEPVPRSGTIGRGVKHSSTPTRGADVSSFAESIARSAIQARHRKAVAGWLKNLSAANLRDPPNLTDLWDEISKRWKEELYFPQLVRHCAQNLPDVLTGAVDLLSLVFEKGSSETMEKIYSVSTLAQYCNAILQEMAAAIVASLDAARPLRVLEIGAGTGATTRYLLPVLPADRTTYVFTDLGPGFLQHAQEKFGAFRFVQYQTLNAEEDPAPQGFQPRSFDVVVAANVLHATRKLKDTLAHVRKLLAPGGFLLLWEATRPQTWMDVSFSLLEGWQRFEDYELRPDQPLLTGQAWLEVLRDQFAHAAVFPEAGAAGEPFGQSVIVAQATPPPRPIAISAAASGPSARSEEWTIEDLAYEVRWEKTAFDALSQNQEQPPGSWLILADAGGVGKSLAQLLADRGGRAVVCYQGDDLRELSSGTWQLDPSKPEHCGRVFTEAKLLKPDSSFHGIISFWGLDIPAEMTLESLEKAQLLGCDIVARLVQSLARQASNENISPRIWLVTRGAQRVTGNETGGPAAAQAMLWGFGRSLAVEHPRWWGGLIDLDPSQPKDDPEALLEIILAETPDDQIALREKARYGCRLVRGPAPTQPRSPLPTRVHGTYLITGGLGGIGLRVARWLVGHGARRLLLLGRSPLPARAKWRQTLKTDSSVAEKIRAVLELESLGANVQIESVDVADGAEVARLFEKYREESWPPITGVFHAAGVIEDCAILDLSPEILDRVLRPKVAGTHLLLKHLDSSALQWVVFFSSASALLGSSASSAYTAANSFLDAWAWSLRRQGIPALSVNWGGWEKTGMAQRGDRGERLSAQGIALMRPEAALEALEFALSHELSQVAVLAADWPRYFQSNVRASASNFLAQLDSKKSTPTQPNASERATATSDTGNQPKRDLRSDEGIEDQLKRIVSEVLKTQPERLEAGRRLSTMGLDSIMAVQIKHEVELAFGVSISAQDIAQSTLASLVQRAAMAAKP